MVSLKLGKTEIMSFYLQNDNELNTAIIKRIVIFVCVCVCVCVYIYICIYIYIYLYIYINFECLFY